MSSTARQAAYAAHRSTWKREFRALYGLPADAPKGRGPGDQKTPSREVEQLHREGK